MYYGIIVVSVIMFVFCFMANDEYRKRQGSTLKSSFRFSFESSLAGLLVILTVNGFKLEFTWFSFALALVSYLVNIGFTFCSFKSLGNINLSLFSLFSMLGGMTLPFLQGIIFFGEEITLAKILCFLLITVALFMTIERGEKKKGTIYYIGVFVLNGMSGVLSKIFAASPYEKTSAAGYSVLCAICATVISAIILFVFYSKKEPGEKFSLASTAISAGGGIINRIANFMLIIALAHVDASVQYPLVTGGVMIVSTIVCFFGKNKPRVKEILSVFVAFIGTLLLFAVPV